MADKKGSGWTNGPNGPKGLGVKGGGSGGGVKRLPNIGRPHNPNSEGKNKKFK